METMKQYHPNVIHKLSCSSFPSAHFISLLASNSNSNSNSNANATKTSSSSVQRNAPSIGLALFSIFMHEVVSTIVGGPLERVQILLQCQGEMVKSGRMIKPYKGIQDCFKSLVKNEGFFSLWRGSFTSMMARLPYQYFTNVYDRLFNVRRYTTGTCERTTRKLLSYIATGTSASLFTYSLDYARTRLANDVIIMDKGSKHKFNGLFDVYHKTLESEGIKGLYCGFNARCLTIAVSRGSKLGIFAFLCATVHPTELQRYGVALAYIAVHAAVAVSYPFDTVCRRMMMTSGESYKYKSAFELASQMLKNEGFKSFYKGFGASCLSMIFMSFALSRYMRLQRSLFQKSGDGKSEVSITIKTKSAGDQNPF